MGSRTGEADVPERVEAMTVDPKGTWKARKAYRDIRATHGVVLTALDSVWHWLNGVTDSIIGAFSGRVSHGFRTVMAAFSTLVDGYGDFLDLYARLYTWIIAHILRPLNAKIDDRYNRLIALIGKRVQYLEGLMFVMGMRIVAYAQTIVRQEADARTKAVSLAIARAEQGDTVLHQTMEREASSAYQMEHDARVSTITRLLEFAVTRNPELRFVVGEAVTVILDILSIDDPVVRLLAGFAVRDIIDKLGVDKLVGNLASDLIQPILGNPAPHNIHDVINDLSTRMAALENFAATFTVDGGSQVEQAGRMWRDITQPLTAAGIAAFMGAAVADPVQWASAVSGTIGDTANAIADATAKLVREA